MAWLPQSAHSGLGGKLSALQWSPAAEGLSLLGAFFHSDFLGLRRGAGRLGLENAPRALFRRAGHPGSFVFCSVFFFPSALSFFLLSLSFPRFFSRQVRVLYHAKLGVYKRLLFPRLRLTHDVARGQERGLLLRLLLLRGPSQARVQRR